MLREEVILTFIIRSVILTDFFGPVNFLRLYDIWSHCCHWEKISYVLDSVPIIRDCCQLYEEYKHVYISIWFELSTLLPLADHCYYCWRTPVVTKTLNHPTQSQNICIYLFDPYLKGRFNRHTIHFKLILIKIIINNLTVKTCSLLGGEKV
jgi:hypothetical protein